MKPRLSVIPPDPIYDSICYFDESGFYFLPKKEGGSQFIDLPQFSQKNLEKYLSDIASGAVDEALMKSFYDFLWNELVPTAQFYRARIKNLAVATLLDSDLYAKSKQQKKRVLGQEESYVDTVENLSEYIMFSTFVDKFIIPQIES